MRKALWVFMVIIGANAGIHLKAQIIPTDVEKALAEQIKKNTFSLRYSSQVKEFYSYRHYKTAWITNDLNRLTGVKCRENNLH